MYVAKEQEVGGTSVGRSTSSGAHRSAPPWRHPQPTPPPPRQHTSRRQRVSFVDPKSMAQNLAPAVKAISPLTALRSTSSKPKSKASPRPPTHPPPSHLVDIDDDDDDTLVVAAKEDNYDDDDSGPDDLAAKGEAGDEVDEYGDLSEVGEEGGDEACDEAGEEVDEEIVYSSADAMFGDDAAEDEPVED